jgi:hypothetical protein
MATSSGLLVDLEGALGHFVDRRVDLHAQTDLLGVGAAVGGLVGAGGPADHLRERVRERDARGLVADGVDVREVVGGLVEHRLVRVEAADRGIHSSHHPDCPSFRGLLEEVRP